MWNLWIFWNKLTFLKTAKDKKFVVGCNWISKISENVDKVASSWEKKIGFSKKIFEFICKPLKAANLMQKAIDFVGFLRTFKNWSFFEKKTDWVIGLSRNLLIFSKSPKVAKLHYKPNEKIKILETFEKCFFLQ